MDSLPNELIEAIIDDIPPSSLHSSSLVARRWRTRSQQRILDFITFSSEDKVDRWYSDVQRVRNRIASYVRSAEFRRIDSWNEPALFGRVLEGLCSLTTLEVTACAIPDELPGQISRGMCGRGITTLFLQSSDCELSTITSMILSLPDLKRLNVLVSGTTLRDPSSTPITPQRRSLDMLELYYFASEVTEDLIQAQITSRNICLDSAISGAHRLIAISSETLVALTLEGL